MKYKEGDKVRVREDLKKDIFYGGHRFEEEQEKFKGKPAIINYAYMDSCDYDLDIDNGEFSWNDEMLEPVAESIADSDENKDEVSTNSVESIDKSIDQFTKADFKFGDILTLRNGDVLIFTGIATMRNSEDMEFELRNYDDINFEYDNSKEFDIMKIERYTDEYKTTGIDCKLMKLETLYERKEEILNEKEKEYLSKFIEPFRDRIREIRKMDYKNEEWLHFILDREDGAEDFSLPTFNKNSMYKGMELDKYTLEELGL